MKCDCGNEMRDLGHWPNHKEKKIVNKWHCLRCSKYLDEDVNNVKLKETDNGDGSISWQEIPG